MASEAYGASLRRSSIAVRWSACLEPRRPAFTALILVCRRSGRAVGWWSHRLSSCGRTRRSARQAFGWRFLTSSRWDPAIDRTFGALPFISGTLVTSMVALLIAVPVGLGVAIFLAELAPRLAAPAAGLPGRAAGGRAQRRLRPVGAVRLRPGLRAPGRSRCSTSPWASCRSSQGPVFGPSRLAAGADPGDHDPARPSRAVSRDVFRAIPRTQREASLALGATRWETISQVLVPYGLSGIPGRDHPGPGPGAGRDDGGHDGDRQQPGPDGLAAASRATPWRRSSPTNSPKRPTTCTCMR